MVKKILIALVCAVCFTGYAQNGTVSPYSFFGIGDFRQKIADSWPCSIDDTSARTDWNWQHQYDLGAITKEMLLKLGQTELI